MKQTLTVSATVVFGAVCAFGAKATEYTYAEPVFFATGAGGSTDLTAATFRKAVGGVTNESSWAEFSAATTGTLVKQGAGEIVITSDLSAFTGEIHAEEGVLKVAHYDGLGSFTGGAAYAHDGATIHMYDPTGRMLPYGAGDAADALCTKELFFEGTGAEGAGGALYATYTGSADSNWTLMRYPTLTGDATIVLDGKTFYSNWRPASELRLNGHALTFKRTSNYAGAYTFYNMNDSTVTAGDITCDHIIFQMYDRAGMYGADECTLRMTNRAELYLWGASANPRGDGRRWTLDWDGLLVNLNANAAGASGYAVTDRERMSWDGPVVLRRELEIYNASEGAAENHCVGFNLNGCVSGAFGLGSYRTGDSNMKYKSDMKLGLSCPTNAFTGGVRLEGTNNVLALYANGALPKDGGAATIANARIHLVGNDVFELPDLNVNGAGAVEQTSVSGGRWKTVTKTGKGALDYNAFAGADVLDVRGGTFRYPTCDCRAVGGLVKSAWTNSSEAAAVADWESDSFHPIATELRAEAAYVHMTGCGWENCVVMAYCGYIRNPDATNVNWSFALAIDWGARLLIDGVEVAKNPMRWYPVRTTVELTPGYHALELRVYAGGYGQHGAYKDTDNVPEPEKSQWVWANDNGFMLDRLGRGTTKLADYVIPVDPGDGSLFAITTNREDIARLTPLPQFGTMRFAQGTTLDLNGWPLAVPLGRIEGCPAVCGGDFTVTESWTIDAVDAAAGAKLTTAGKLTFAEGAKIKVVDSGKVCNSPAEGWTIVEAEGGIELPDGWRDAAELPKDGSYGLKLSDDGKKLVLTRFRGVVLIVR